MKLRFLLLLAVLLAVPLQAQLVPAGSDVRVDAGEDRQEGEVAVSMASDGSYLVAWTYRQTGNTWSCSGPAWIYGRSFDRTGQPLQAQPFIVSDAREACIESLRIGDLVDGRRLAVWTETYGELGAERIVLASIGPTGRARRVREIPKVKARAAGDTAVPLRSGRFLVVDHVLKDRRNELRGRRFSAAGKPLGSSFVIARASGTFISPFYSVDAAETAGGGLAVAWSLLAPGGPDRPLVFGAALSADGRLKQPVQQLSGPEYELRGPRVASDASGRFVIVWSSIVPGGTVLHPAIWARLFEANGTPRSDLLNLTPDDSPDRYRFLEALAMDAGGEFVPVWALFSDTYSPEDVGAELVDADGTPLDRQEPLAGEPAGTQVHSDISTDRHGLWVVAWNGDGPEGAGVYVRLFREVP